MTGPALAFEGVVHPLAAEGPGPVHTDRFGAWPTLAVPRGGSVAPFTVTFDEALARLADLAGVFTEPDGAVLAVDPVARAWQVDAQLADLGGCLLTLELKGSCPSAEFDRLLASCGWPATPVMVQLPRDGVFLDETTFRRHAAARWVAGCAQTLRPS